jgi:hypothetical protein
MNESELAWTKAQMYEALRMYQTGLAEIHQHVDRTAEQFKGKTMAPEVHMLLDQIVASIVQTTVDVARLLDA